MKPFQIYHVSSQKGFIIQKSNCHYISEFGNIHEAKEMMIAQLPDVIIYEINEMREAMAIFHFLKALNKKIPMIIVLNDIAKDAFVDLLTCGTIDFVDLKECGAVERINKWIEENKLKLSQEVFYIENSTVE